MRGGFFIAGQPVLPLRPVVISPVATPQGGGIAIFRIFPTPPGWDIMDHTETVATCARYENAVRVVPALDELDPCHYDETQPYPAGRATDTAGPATVSVE